MLVRYKMGNLAGLTRHMPFYVARTAIAGGTVEAVDFDPQPTEVESIAVEGEVESSSLFGGKKKTKRNRRR